MQVGKQTSTPCRCAHACTHECFTAPAGEDCEKFHVTVPAGKSKYSLRITFNSSHARKHTHTHTHKHRDGLSIIGEIQVRVSVHVFACLWLCKSEVKISVREGDWSQIGLGCDGRSEVRVGSRPGTRTHQSFKRVWSRSVRKQYLFRVLFGATHPLVSASDSSANEFLTRQTQRPVPPPFPPPPPPSPSPHPPPQPAAAMASCQPLPLPSLAVPARALARVAAPGPVGQLPACRNRSMTCGARNS